MSTVTSRDPKVKFKYEGEIYKGREIGMAMPRDENEDWVKTIVTSDEIEEDKIYLDNQQVSYSVEESSDKSKNNKNNNKKKKSSNDKENKTKSNRRDLLMSMPDYNKNTDDGWKAFKRKDGVDEVTGEEDLKEVSKGYRTHKELKNENNVAKVQGEKIDGKKYYKLFYHPNDIE